MDLSAHTTPDATSDAHHRAIAAAETGALTQLDLLLGFDEPSAFTLEAELVAPASALV